MEKLTNFYTPFRERIGDIGVIAAGIALAAVSFFIRTDIFETILDYVGVMGMATGVTIAAVGIFMLGTETRLVGEDYEVNQAIGECLCSA